MKFQNNGAAPGTTNRFTAVAPMGSTFPVADSLGFSLTLPSVCKNKQVGMTTVTASLAESIVAAQTAVSIAITPGPVAPATSRFIPVNEVLQLKAIATMTDGSTQDVTLDANNGGTWAATNGNAIFTTNGELNAVSAGADVITVSAFGATGSLNITVVNCGDPASVTITPVATGPLPVGQTRKFTAQAVYAAAGACAAVAAADRTYDLTTPTLNNAGINNSLNFSSSIDADLDFGGASPQHNNVANGKAAGAPIVTAVYNPNGGPGVTSNPVTVNVVAVTIKTLTIAPTTLNGNVGTSPQFTVSAVWTDGTNNFNLAPPNLSFTVADGTVAAAPVQIAPFDNSSWKIKGLKAGSTTFFASGTTGMVTATSNTATLNVAAACIKTVVVTGFSNGGNPYTLPLTAAVDGGMARGVPGTITFTCTDSNGMGVAPCNGAIFSVGGAATLLSDNQTFYVPATTAGGTALSLTAQIPVSAGGCDATAKGTLASTASNDTTLSYVASPLVKTIQRSTTQQFSTSAQLRDSAAQVEGVFDLTALTTFTSSAPAIATVTAGPLGGLATAGNTDGSTFIQTSILGAVKNSSTGVAITDAANKVPQLTVSGAALKTITISAKQNLVGGPGTSATYPASSALATPFKLQFNASGSNTDGSSAGDITTSVTWAIVPPAMPNGDNSAIVVGPAGNGGLLTLGTKGGITINLQATKGAVSSAVFPVTIDGGAITAVAIVNSDGTAAATSIPAGLGNSYDAQVSIGAAAYWGGSNMSWVSSAPGVAAFVGLHTPTLNGVMAGTTNITSTAPNGTSTGGPLGVTITNAVPVSLACAPAAVTTTVGGKSQLTATLTDSLGNHTDVTSTSTWNSADNTLAQFLGTDPIGDVTGVALTAGVHVFPSGTYSGVALSATGTPCIIKVQ